MLSVECIQALVRGIQTLARYAEREMQAYEAYERASSFSQSVFERNIKKEPRDKELYLLLFDLLPLFAIDVSP